METGCPTCGYDLAATIEAGLHRCPECGAGFVMAPVSGGWTVRLRSDEKRVSGRWLILGFIILFVLMLVFTLVYGGRGLAP